ncbi:Aluminum-activated malate transporter [Macleaya cordata]|uniref:Aluminum-activated malate transporter n=1 Tax=Macleaya cordata TaxID=56857 RepID=A0A200PTH6_MACCD|nr:Aluminum-activated malate transporter [Macleaya cordata]
MVNDNQQESSGGLEWRVRMADGSSEILVPETGLIRRTGLSLLGLISGLVMKVRNFLQKAWDLGIDDPRKFIHCLKVGLALTVVSLFYYMRPLYDGVGGNAMWAVMTVVVVFEFTVGSTLYKCLNRIVGTSLAGALAIGVHWVASKSGDKFEPVILGTSVFFLAIAATFSRFIPTVKARFDYGAMIFILTFSLVSVSGYRVDKLFELAQQRLSTIAIGTALCLLVSMLICPVWAGKDLHDLITRNMDKLADSLDGCVAEYFTESSNTDDENEQDCRKKLQGYKCVLNSKASEDSLANFARWEPAHGNFGFRHPWKQYLKIGTMMRSCAYCIEALNGCINSEFNAHEFTKKHLSDVCMKLSSHSSRVLKDLAIITKKMTKSSTIDFSVGEMNSAVEDLQNVLKSLSTQLSRRPPLTVINEALDENETRDNPISTAILIPLMDVLPLVTLSSLLIEITTRIEKIVDAVDELSSLADFKPANEEKPKQNQPNLDQQVQETMKTLQMV